MLSVTLHSPDYEKQSLLLHPAKCFFFSWHSASPQQTLSTPPPSIPKILQQAEDSCLPRVNWTPKDAFLFVKLVQSDQQVIAFKNMFILCINQSEKVFQQGLTIVQPLSEFRGWETSQDKRWGPSWTGPRSITGLTHRDGQLHTLTFTFNASVTIEWQQPPKKSQWLHLVTGYK